MRFLVMLIIFAALRPEKTPACEPEKPGSGDSPGGSLPGVPESNGKKGAEVAEPLALSLPTENQSILESQPASFYMGVDRDGKRVWQGGTFGFVRSPMAWPGGTVSTQFHEGIDIAPVKRDAGGRPCDVVRAISAGTVVLSETQGRTRYGNQVVCRHEWFGGAVFCRYAHLSSVQVTSGEKVKRGQELGVMGYTGGALTMERAHLHFEINLMRNEACERSWLPSTGVAEMEPKFHPANFAGVDAAALFLALREKPALTFPEFIKSRAPYFTVVTAGGSPVDLLKRHPWLGDGKDTAPGWKVSFTEWGLPVRFEALEEPPVESRVLWVQAFEGKHAWRTGGLLSGSGDSASLDTRGKSLMRIIFGQ